MGCKELFLRMCKQCKKFHRQRPSPAADTKICLEKTSSLRLGLDMPICPKSNVEAKGVLLKYKQLLVELNT